MGFISLKKPKQFEGADAVNIRGPASTFGSISVNQLQAQAQGDFVYGIQDQTFVTSSFIGSTVTAVDGMCELSSGVDPNGSATVQLRRGLKYRPGQGSMMRATALYDTPSAGSAQFIGAGTAESGYFIGYFGNAWGILHSQTGQREIRELEITTPVTTDEIVTVTLNGEAIAIPVTGSASTTQTAYQIAQADYSQIGGAAGGFLADVISSSVYFISARSTASATGTYSVAGSTIAGTFTQVKAGVAQTNTFIPSSSFNVDRLDGTGPTGMILNPQNGNVFQIDFQYLGFGNANFSIEDPNTGFLTPFHRIKNANARTTPVLKNPNLSCLATSANIAGGTTSKTLKTVSMATFIEGSVTKLDPKYAKSFSFASVTEANFTPLALLKANRVFNDESCFGEFDILRLAASNTATASGKTLTVGFFINAKIGGEVNYEYVDEQNSIVSYAVLTPDGLGKNTIDNLSELTPFYEIVLNSGQSNTENLDTLEFLFSVGKPLLIAIKGNTVDGDVSINWFEQQ
jgi:hypothetical protein